MDNIAVNKMARRAKGVLILMLYHFLVCRIGGHDWVKRPENADFSVKHPAHSGYAEVPVGTSCASDL